MFKASMFKTRLNIAAITLGVGLLSIGNVVTAQDKTVSADAKTPTALTKRASSTQSPKGFLLKTIEHGGQQYRYVLYVPEDYDATKPYPTIIFLNGAGECGRDGLKQAAVGIGPAIMLDVDKWRFLVLIPQKPDIKDRWEDDDKLVLAMLDVTKKTYKVDADRLYLTGLSQGGHGTWAIGAKHPDLFAAIAPVCGWGDVNTAAALKNTPIWAFHGEADMTVPVKGSIEMVEAARAAGGDAKITTYPGVGHNSWDNAYREAGLADWFLLHTRKK